MMQQTQTQTPPAPPAAPNQANNVDVRSIVRDVRQGLRDGLNEARRNGEFDQQQVGDEVRATIEDALRAAEEAAVAAEEAAVAGQPPAPPSPGDNDINIRMGPNGLEIVTTDQETGTTTTMPFDASNVIPPQVPEILFIGVMGIIGIILAFPIGRAVARYIDRRGTVTKASDELTQRLDAIERAVDTVAVEMERLSEANRFTSKLLSERVAAPDFAAGARHAADASPEFAQAARPDARSDARADARPDAAIRG